MRFPTSSRWVYEVPLTLRPFTRFQLHDAVMQVLGYAREQKSDRSRAYWRERGQRHAAVFLDLNEVIERQRDVAGS